MNTEIGSKNRPHFAKFVSLIVKSFNCKEILLYERYSFSLNKR